MTARPKLSVIIVSLANRAKLLHGLLENLAGQKRADETEVLVAVDHGGATIADKRNRLVAAARGAYIVHIDDDDRVSPNYSSAILHAVESHPLVTGERYEVPGPDVVLVRGERTVERYDNHGRKVVVDRVLFDYRIGGLEAEMVGGVLWRSPGHLCPVRADIAKAVDFPAMAGGVGEDLCWLDAIKPRLRTAARAGSQVRSKHHTRGGELVTEVLYYYRFEPVKSTPALAREAAYRAGAPRKDPTDP